MELPQEFFFERDRICSQVNAEGLAFLIKKKCRLQTTLHCIPIFWIQLHHVMEGLDIRKNANQTKRGSVTNFAE